MSCLYIWGINPFLVTSLANTFYHFWGCLFVLFRISFAVQKLLIRPHLFIFVFIFIPLGVGSKKILLWKEWSWVIGRDVEGPRVCHTVKSERQKQLSFINAYMWNLATWYRWTYFQGRKRDTDVENGRVGTGGEGREAQSGRVTLTYMHCHV